MARTAARRLYYHGTAERFTYSILTRGFKVGEKRYGRGLGRGLYLSGSLRFACDWGEMIIVCKLGLGTRILWHRPPDQHVISYLKREFGKGIPRPDFYKAIPRNKRLTRRELTNLWNFLVVKHYSSPRRFSRNAIREFQDQHAFIYEHVRRHGYDAVGFEEEDWPELLMFNPSRVTPVSAHTYIYKRHVVLSDALPLDRLHAIQDQAAEDLKEFRREEEEALCKT